MIHRAKNQPGFTLIELMMALAFTAFIIIFATTAVIQVMQTYNKGMAVKQINQAGRSTLEDITRSLRTTDPGAVNVSAINDGRMCLGGVSYVWNKYDTPSATANRYDDGTELTMVRVSDPASAMCSGSSGNYQAVPKAQATSILTGNVWVMAVSVSAPSVSAPLTDVTIKLAVANDPAIFEGQCAVGGAQGQFCATSDFSTTVLTGGGE